MAGVGPAVWYYLVSRKIDAWAGRMARMSEMRSAYMVLMGKSEGKRFVGRPRLRWKNDFEMYLQELKWGPGLD